MASMQPATGQNGQWTFQDSPQPQAQPPLAYAMPGYPGVPLQQQFFALTAAQLGEQYRVEQFTLCAQGIHERTTKYGVVGVIIAIIFFPIGLLALLVDKTETCTRCGKVLQ